MMITICDFIDKRGRAEDDLYVLTRLLVMYIDEAFAKMYIQYPFVATTMNNEKYIQVK